jgi:peptide/nickel transport system permease protein
MRLVDILLAVPSFLLLLSTVAILGPGSTTTIIALGISFIPGYARLVRGSVLAARRLEYVVAAQVVGVPSQRVMFRHILPNIVGILIIYSTVGLGEAILVTAGLGFLRLGAQPPSPEWGAMLNAGTPFLRDAWWMASFPGLAIFSAVLCINLLGDGLRDMFDPSGRR